MKKLQYAENQLLADDIRDALHHPILFFGKPDGYKLVSPFRVVGAETRI